MNSLISSRKTEDSALQKAVRVWAQATTPQELARASDIERDKRRCAFDFFSFAGEKSLEDISVLDIQEWHKYLKARNYKPKTIYTYFAHLSSFFEWLRKEPSLNIYLTHNPVRMAMPPAPKKYNSESTNSLSNQEFSALWKVLEEAGSAHELVGIRDYAIFLFFVTTGMRRAEILNLKGKDIEIIDDGLLLKACVKGRDYLSRHIADLEVKESLLRYLKAAKRTYILGKDQPLWARCDRGKPHDDDQISSYGFVKRMKMYSQKAGLKHFHLHQLRHTFARIVSEESGSLIETQEALGHTDVSTTRIYVQRIAIKKDKFSQKIKQRRNNVG